MYCEKCGTKNIKNALYCEKCGKKLPKNSKNPKLNLSKNKLITSIVVIIIIICLLILSILLNNPIKKVEDNFDSFYTKYTAKSDLSKLTEIGKVIKNNQDDSKILNNIKDTSYKIINRWVKNFNTNYKDADALEKAYSKITGILYDIYNYYDGLEYILDEKTYTNYKESLNDLYYSKNAYLEALKQKEDYYKYYYYQKVIEEDSYYNKAETFIAKFVEKEINTLKEEANKIVNIVNTKNDQEILDAYFTKLDYLDEHAYQHNIDISNTKEYQKLYQDTLKNIVEYT